MGERLEPTSALPVRRLVCKNRLRLSKEDLFIFGSVA